MPKIVIDPKILGDLKQGIQDTRDLDDYLNRLERGGIDVKERRDTNEKTRNKMLRLKQGLFPNG